MREKPKIVAVSGYFNPVHSGHINLFREAKKIVGKDGKLVVILNNDEQIKLKGSFPFMSAKERMKIVKAIKYVDKVVLAIDKDKTVCKTLEMLKPAVFANGGDRKSAQDVPEAEVCKKLGIKMVFNVGGAKTQSSSWLLSKVKNCRS